MAEGDHLLAYLEARERQVVTDALAQHGGDLDRAASALGMTARQLAFRLRRLGLSVTDPHAR